MFLFWRLAKLLWFLAKLLLGLARLLGTLARLIAGVTFRLAGLMGRWIEGRTWGRSSVQVRRDWNDHRVGRVQWSDLENPRWDTVAGGTQVESRQPFIYAYVSCDKVRGDIAHSCTHGPPPHNIKVCLMKRDNSRDVWNRLIQIAGPDRR